MRTFVHIANDGFEFINVGEKSLSAAFGDAIDRLRSPRAAQLLGDNDAELSQRMHVPVQIPIGKIACRLKLGKAETVGMRDQARANGEAPTLVKIRSNPG